MKKKNYGIVMKYYRKMRFCYTHHLRFISKIVFRLIYLHFNCYIPPEVEMEENVTIAHGIGIVIHGKTKIGKGTIIYQNVTIGGRNGQTGIVIGEKCTLGAGCCILGNIKIGNNVKIGANAVVLQDIPDDSTVVGVPGIIKRL